MSLEEALTDDLIPVAKLTREGQGHPLITDISTPEGWRAVHDTMALDDPSVPLAENVEGWRIELSVMPRSEYEALPEHEGW